jgi:arsenate reductase
MAEAFLSHLGGDAFEAESAGLEPGTLNPLAVEVMKEGGIDISGKKTKSAFDLFKSGRTYSFVIMVCDEASVQRCPLFPGLARRLQWDLPDPAALQGSLGERLEKTRQIRDEIRRKVEEFVSVYR